MNTHFTAEFFQGNRERLRNLFTGTAPIVVTANGLLQRSSDNAFAFHQDPNFWYLTGLDDPDLVLVMDKGKEYVIVPELSDSRQAFDGAFDVAHMHQVSGIELFVPEKEGWKQLSSRLKRAKHVATFGAPAAYIEHYGLYTNPAKARLTRRLKAENADIALLDLRQHLMRMRMVKQPVELEALQAAIDVTIAALKKIARPKQLASYVHEYELEADVTAVFRRNNATHAYSPIVAAGKNACTLHYLQNNSAIQPGALILLDVGASVAHYAADITRTYAVGEPTKRQLQVWQAVQEVQAHALELLRPGLLLAQYEKQLELFMGEKLRELGLIKVISHEQVRQYFPHGTSHFLGLDVHDVGDYEAPLEPGMVLTCEPGIYIPEEGIGIRIEDDVAITEHGSTVLSAALPRTLV